MFHLPRAAVGFSSRKWNNVGLCWYIAFKSSMVSVLCCRYFTLPWKNFTQSSATTLLTRRSFSIWSKKPTIMSETIPSSSKKWLYATNFDGTTCILNWNFLYLVLIKFLQYMYFYFYFCANSLGFLSWPESGLKPLTFQIVLSSKLVKSWLMS